jgi:maltokinase
VSESTKGSGPSYAVTDFDGNPVLSPADRVAPAPAAVDVAGLLQSLDHVGRVVSHRTEHFDAALVEEWIAGAQGALLDRYRAALAEAGRPHLLDESLLPTLRVRQVVREYLYAARHLPHWRYVPHSALPAVVAGAQTPGRPVRRPTDQA